MRIGYIGLSTPLFYDYKTQGPRLPTEQMSSPNPILDSPFGLLMLFDEIWFLSRSLCPQNMRHLPYVRFMDECGLLPENLEAPHLPDIPTLIKEPAIKMRYEHLRQALSLYEANEKRVGIYWDAIADHHTDNLKIGPLQVRGDSLDLRNVLLDIEIVHRLKDKRRKVELVTNSFTQRCMDSSAGASSKAGLAEQLVIERIPNYLSPTGPYHSCVEEARGNKFLKDFRKWISAQPAGLDSKEIKDVKIEVENAIQEERDRIFLKHLDPKTEYLSVGKTLLGVVVDALVPGVSVLADLADKIKEHLGLKSTRWQGFFVSLAKNRSTTKHLS